LKVREGEEVLYLAKGCLKVLKDKKAQVLEELPGSRLVGWEYQGPFDDLPAVKKALGPHDHRVIPWTEVSESEGTGIVHIAPGCGKEDFGLGKEQKLPAISPIAEEGVYAEGFGPLPGRKAGKAAEQVMETVDQVKIACPKCGGRASRVKDVGNPWLDAGIVPFSTLGYTTDRTYWEKWFPADFVTESFPGQFRNWFYSLLAMSTALVDRPPFKTLFGYALVRDEKGQEMHKSLGNAIEFNAAAD